MHAAKRLPAANWLRLSIAPASAARSAGALKSAAAVLTGGGYAISKGALHRQVIAHTSWHISWPGEAGKSRRYAAVPRAELIAAQRSAGIGNIVTGAEMPLAAVLLLRFAGPLPGMILRSMAARKSAPQTSGNQDVAHLKSRIFAEAGSAEGLQIASMLETAEGYTATANAALRVVELIAAQRPIGALTPAQAFGPSFALTLPDTAITDLAADTSTNRCNRRKRYE